MKIAAFNVQRLGKKKLDDPDTRRILMKIVSRYSVVVLLEVLDRSNMALERFLKDLNDYGGRPYAMMKSGFLGRSSYREQFVFIYRKDEASVIKRYQYEEREDEDRLEREPFIIRLKCQNTVIKNLVLIPVHTKPSDAEIELDALDEVVQDVRRRWRTNNIMILGDFNADGTFLSQRGMKNVRIRYPPYHWLIDDDVDTTTSDTTDHTYDRIVVYGRDMLRAVVQDSAQPFDFRRAYHLSWATTLKVSDHYPVEVELEED